jgi:CubicO group peptidase (beta-lactamase class C family)
LERYKVAGASLAIIEQGELAAAYCYGEARAGRAMSVSTRFQAASISKTINALAVLKLVALGRMGLDDPVNQHLRSWTLPGNALTEKTAVTIRMLLSHTGGTTVPGFAGYLPNVPLPTLEQVLDGRSPANSDPVRVAWPPGEGFRYSGGGTTILQQLVIDVTGYDYPTAAERLVLGPLDMKQSDYIQEPDILARADLALAHGPDGSANPGGFRIHPELAAAGLWTTPSDLVRALLAIINSRRTRSDAFLPQELAQAMLTPVAQGSGLGVFIEAKNIFSHPGSNIGYRALLAGDAEADQGMVVMTNGDNGENLCQEIRRRIAEIFRWR